MKLLHIGNDEYVNLEDVTAIKYDRETSVLIFRMGNGSVYYMASVTPTKYGEIITRHYDVS